MEEKSGLPNLVSKPQSSWSEPSSSIRGSGPGSGQNASETVKLRTARKLGREGARYSQFCRTTLIFHFHSLIFFFRMLSGISWERGTARSLRSRKTSLAKRVAIDQKLDMRTSSPFNFSSLSCKGATVADTNKSSEVG